MKRYGIITAGVLGAALFCSALLAADMTFKGTLIDPPPCTINGNLPVTVDFGNNIGVNRVDGVNYIQPVEYHLMCDLTSPHEGLSMVMTTTDPASFDASAIQSSTTGLAIRVLVDGVPVTFGDVIAVDSASPPVMQAVPVKADGVIPAEGAFTATATLQVVYQ